MLAGIIGFVAKVATVVKTTKDTYDTVRNSYDDAVERRSTSNALSSVDQRLQELGLESRERLNSIESKIETQNEIIGGSLNSFGDAIKEQSAILSGVQTSMVALQNGIDDNNRLIQNSIGEILNLQKNIANLDSKIDRGFLDLQHFISNRVDAVIDYQKNIELSRAYEFYVTGLNEMKRAFMMSDIDRSRLTLNSAIDKINQSLILYNSHIKSGTLNSGAKLKSQQTILIAEATLAETYIAVGETDVGKEIYFELQNKTKSGLKEVISEAQGNMKTLAISDSKYIMQNDMKEIDKRLES